MRRVAAGAVVFLMMAAGVFAARLQAASVLDQVRAQFNKDKGALRLIVLVSPTCPLCTSGAGWINEYVLKRHKDLNLKVYAVWFEMYPGDSPEAYPDAQELLADRRVKHWWDKSKQTGRQFVDIAPTNLQGDIQWDAFYLYSPDAVWEKGALPGPPDQLLTYGRTILQDRYKLRDEIDALVAAGENNAQARP